MANSITAPSTSATVSHRVVTAASSSSSCQQVDGIVNESQARTDEFDWNFLETHLNHHLSSQLAKHCPCPLAASNKDDTNNSPVARVLYNYSNF